jgi:general secretion pathway protein L
MTLILVRFPVRDGDDPTVWRVADGDWQSFGPLSAFQGSAEAAQIAALVSAGDVHVAWTDIAGLAPRQAEGVARVRAGEAALGDAHIAARHIGDDRVVTATISAPFMEKGLARLALHGLDPDLVVPFGAAIAPAPDEVAHALFDGDAVLRGPQFAIPDEPALRSLLVGDTPVAVLDEPSVRSALAAIPDAALPNLREGRFAKRVRRAWLSDEQRVWLTRLTVALVLVSLLLGIVTYAKYRSAMSEQNRLAIAAAQRIDPSIADIETAESKVDAALVQKGLATGRFAPLSAGLWRAVKTSPNVTVRELRFAPDGILTVVLSAPDANSVNRALIAIQQDGYRVTATPRQDNSGATLVDLTMRMP